MVCITTCLITGLIYIRPNMVQLKQNSTLLIQQNPSKQNNFSDLLEDAWSNISLHCILIEMRKDVLASEYATSQKAWC